MPPTPSRAGNNLRTVPVFVRPCWLMSVVKGSVHSEGMARHPWEMGGLSEPQTPNLHTAWFPATGGDSRGMGPSG